MQRKYTLAAAAIALAAASLPLHAQVTFTGLGTAVSNITVTDVSKDGSALVGYAGFPATTYIWTTTSMTWTAVPAAAGIYDFDISNGGQYLSATLPDPGNGNLDTAARLDVGTGVWTFLPGLGGSSGSSLSSAYDMSEDGSVVVGLGWITANRAHAFRWDSNTGVTTDLGALAGNLSSSRPNAVSPDGVAAAGWDEDDVTGQWRAARWVGLTENLLGCLDPNDPINGPSEGYAVSSNGQFVAGESATGLYTPSYWPELHGFRWDAVNGLIDIGTSPVDIFGWGTHHTFPTAISDDGRTIVGSSGVVAFGPGASLPVFIWREGSGLMELGAFLTAMGVPEGSTWIFEDITGMSADGRVLAGYGYNPSFQREAFRIELPAIAENFCVAKVNSQGCTPSMTSSGIASASSALPFDVGATNVINNKNGLMYYGFASLNAPFQGGTKCVAQPSKRTAVQDSFGNAGADDCSGTYSIDVNALIQGGGDPALVVGASVYAQYWSRDPASPSTTGLTDGLAFTVFP